jgi:hypothetical protein
LRWRASTIDQNIVCHWLAIAERRRRAGQRVAPKYFHYLALLFAEVYLDRCFIDADGLLRRDDRP